MATRYQSANEEKMHLEAMQQIAAESGQDLQHIRRIYESEFMRLQDGAQIRDYLVLLTARRAKETLAHTRANKIVSLH